MATCSARLRIVRVRAALTAFGGLLDAEDRRHAHRNRGPADAERSAAGIALLKGLAAELSGSDPASLVVGRRCPRCHAEDHGQPTLPGGVFGSISHAGGWVAAAVHPSRRIGIDVEEADREISEDLTSLLLAADDPGRGAFDPARDALRLWVRKEAVLKATGEGLGTPPHRVQVSPAAAPPALLRHTRMTGLRADLHDLDAPSGVLASLAVLRP